MQKLNWHGLSLLPHFYVLSFGCHANRLMWFWTYVSVNFCCGQCGPFFRRQCFCCSPPTSRSIAAARWNTGDLGEPDAGMNLTTAPSSFFLEEDTPPSSVSFRINLEQSSTRPNAMSGPFASLPALFKCAAVWIGVNETITAIRIYADVPLSTSCWTTSWSRRIHLNACILTTLYIWFIILTTLYIYAQLY